jgi:hypothetical protein
VNTRVDRQIGMATIEISCGLVKLVPGERQDGPGNCREEKSKWGEGIKKMAMDGGRRLTLVAKEAHKILLAHFRTAILNIPRGVCQEN